ncbi:MAG TPA: MerR family transcriptional regulator [Desulfocapsa sulfexigens]|nr:MerR family transcriptional regulator [Desulfocapsa sulfexigens]
MSIEIPDKLYFKIGEVSKLACVAPHVLRYWESEFKEIQPKRANSNQRLYRREDVKIVLLVKTLLHEQGYTLSGAKKFLAGKKQSLLTPPKTDIAGCLQTIKEELLAVDKMLNKKE